MCGIKVFIVCEITGYLWNSLIYSGKTITKTLSDVNMTRSLGVSGAVVPLFMFDLYDQGYHLHLDNWYTSPKLSFYLEENKTVACDDTVRRNHLDIPVSFREAKV